MVFNINKNLYVYYNMHQHLPFNGGYSESPNLCKKWDETETGPIFMSYTEIPFDEVQDGGNEYVTIQNLEALYPGLKGVMDPLSSFPNQGRLRHSDINIDGYADLFLTLEFTDKSKKSKSVVLMSHACTAETCPTAASEREIPRRYFNATDKEVNIQRITDLAGDTSVMLVPFDVDEDGRMDIIVQKT